MIRTILATLLALFAGVAFAAVDVNRATQAELETVKGIGPAISGTILEERKKGPFKDWQDMVDRVKGIGEGNAARFSAEGLTVNGAAFAAKQEKEKADKTATAKATREARPGGAAASAASAGARK